MPRPQDPTTYVSQTPSGRYSFKKETTPKERKYVLDYVTSSIKPVPKGFNARKDIIEFDLILSRADQILEQTYQLIKKSQGK